MLGDWSKSGGSLFLDLDSWGLLDDGPFDGCYDLSRNLDLDLLLDISEDSLWMERGHFSGYCFKLCCWPLLNDCFESSIVFDTVILGPDGPWSFLEDSLSNGIVDNHVLVARSGDCNLLSDGSWGR